MQLTVRHKLALALVTMVIVINLLLFGLVYLSFQQGFLQYVNDIQTNRITEFAEDLGEEFTTPEAFSSAVSRRHSWRALINEYYFDRGPDNDHERHTSSHHKHHRSPKHGSHKPPKGQRGPKFLALDHQGNLLVGKPNHLPNITFVPVINEEGEKLGSIGLPPVVDVTSDVDQGFVEEQSEIFAWAALIVSLLSAALAWPLTKLLVKPLISISHSVSELTQGNFNTQIQLPKQQEQDELGQLANNVNTLARTLKQHEESRRQWVADISHELRTPVNILKGELEAIEDGVRPLTEATFKSLQEEAKRLERLVEDLHQLSMSDLGALTYQFSEINIISLLENLLDQNELLASKAISNHLIVQGEPVIVPGDEDRIQQLFVNLLQNTHRYTNQQGQLQITLSYDKALTVTWEDSAPAVDPEHLPKLFDRLFRTEESRNTSTGGSGLGLSICKNIVDAHNGTITATASELGGLAICIVLPL